MSTYTQTQRHTDTEISWDRHIDREIDRNTIINNKYIDTDLNKKLKFEYNNLCKLLGLVHTPSRESS